MHICDRICEKGVLYSQLQIFRNTDFNYSMHYNFRKDGAASYTILHDYTAIQGVSVDTVFNGLLAEFPAILDSFFHQYHKHTSPGAVGGGLGWRQVHKNFTVVFLGPIEALLHSTFHKKVLNLCLISLSSRVAIFGQLGFCSGQPQHCDVNPRTTRTSEGLQNQPQ